MEAIISSPESLTAAEAYEQAIVNILYGLEVSSVI